MSEIVKFESFVRIPDKFFKVAGLTPIRKHYGRQLVLVERIVFWVTSTNLFMSLLAEFMYFFKSFGSFKHFLEITALAPCMGFVILSLVKMVTVKSNFSKLLNLLFQLEQNYPKMEREQKMYNIRKYLVETNFVMTIFATLYMILIWMFNLVPCAVMIYNYNYSKEQDFQKELPYFLYYPFNVYAEVIFEIAYIFQVQAGFTSAVYILSSDLLFCAIIILICMQFDIVQEKLRNSSGKYEDLAEIIKAHSDLIEHCIQLESIFSPSILVNFIGSSLIICLVGFQATAGVTSVELFKFALFLLSSLVQIFMLCHYGNKLIIASSDVASGAYEGDWYNANSKYKKSLSLIIMRSQKPQNLTAFKFYVVSLSNFSKILSTSFSYFTLLRTIYEPNQKSAF